MSRGSGGRGRGKSKGRGNSSRTSIKMTPDRARAIQSHADRSGRNQDFKSRAMSAADKNNSE